MDISIMSFRPRSWLSPTGSAMILVTASMLAPHAQAACPSQDVETKDLVAVKSPEDLDCHLERKRFDPDNRLWAQESYRFAKQTAIWVAKVLSDEGATDPAAIAAQFPVSFAFYPDGRYEYGTCEKNTASKYLKKGGAGEPLCNLMEETSSLGSGSLTDLTVQLMEAGRSQAVNSDAAEAISQAKQKAMNGIFAQVRELGFNPYYQFTQEYNTNLDYNPKVDEFGNMIPVSPSQTDYAGLSGGGGSGAGFGLYCLRSDNNTQLTILESGGGGGAGATSPGGAATPLEAGGGGNAGMRIRQYTWDKLPVGKYRPTETADSPLETFSFSQLNWGFGAIYDDDSVVNWSALPQKMSNAIDSLKKCRDNQWPIQIRGGGGGGEGFEFLKTSGGQDDLLALNLGYGFQFAIGLDANGQPVQLYRHPVPILSQKQVIVCPYTREIGIGLAKEAVVDWRKCLSDNLPPTAQQSQSQQPPSLYSCMGTIVPAICKTATYVDASDGKTKSYTAYGSYNSCNGPISAWYKEEYGTLWDKIYEPSSKGPPNAPPVITKATFQKSWCSGIKLPSGCGQLKECQ